MTNIFTSIKFFLSKHNKIRNIVRRLRWDSKKIPLLRDAVILFEKKYFKYCAAERHNAINHTEANDYFESYASILSSKVYGKVLDLGCGYGYLTKRIAQNTKVDEVTGVDKINNFKCFDNKIKFVSKDLAVDSDLPKDIDVIVSSEFIEHLEERDFKNLLLSIRSSLKQNGIYIGSTPLNPTNYKTFSGSPFHMREYNQKDLEKILNEVFSEASVIPISKFCLIWEARK